MAEARGTDYSCVGKVRFASPTLAVKVKERRARRGKKNEPYRCPACGYWHLGRRLRFGRLAKP